MKRYLYLVTLLVSLMSHSKAQVIGGNGEGFSANFSMNDVPSLLELTTEAPIAIRWPGGGDSKVSFPALDKPGLGMNEDSIKRLYDEFRDSQGLIKAEAMEKDLAQVPKDRLNPESELMQIIRAQKAVPELQVSYALNVMQGTVQTNLRAIKTLIDSGVNIIAIVAGNETFASYNYDWEKYRNDFEPILKACQEQYPNIPRLLCIGQAIQRKTHIQWNAKLINYINSTGDFISGVDIHYYLMEELKEANSLHPGMVKMEADKPNAQLEKAFDRYIELYRTDDKMQSLVAYLKLNLPDKIYHCTEFGDKEAENWSNTIASGAHIFNTFCENRNSFDVLLVQNLLGNWLWAARRPVGKLDIKVSDETKLNRIPWFALQMANELPLNAKPIKSLSKITARGTYYYYFDCAGDPEQNWPIFISENLHATMELHFVTGKFTYSSAGASGFWSKDSDKFYEVKGIDIATQAGALMLPRNSFGYVKVMVW